MKTTIITLIILTIIAYLFYSFVKNNETYQYKVLKEYEKFEIRKYESALFTSVQLKSEGYKSTSSSGFNVLAGYIFGKNEREEKIAMTTPVTMELNDTITMRFLVPSKYKKEELPAPNDKQIAIEEVPGKIVAVVHFSGWANDEKIAEHKQLLINELAKAGLDHNGIFTFMGYNAPFDPINRRNEVMVELLDYQK